MTVLALLLVARLVPVTILEGWVLSILWRWFVAPALGLPLLTVAQAIGVALVVAFLRDRYEPRPRNQDWGGVARDMAGRLAHAVFACGVLLALGWIVAHWTGGVA